MTTDEESRFGDKVESNGVLGRKYGVDYRHIWAIRKGIKRAVA